MKILIVDDSQAMRKIIKWTIKSADINADQIFEASCSDDALLLSETKNLDLIITDWNMPEMGGLELLKTLRNSNNMVKFGFVVTQSSANIHNLAKNAGANFIITNPTSSNTFATQINQVL